MNDSTDVCRLPNGSIDIEHYVRIGRALHGSAVRETGRKAFTAPDALMGRIGNSIRRAGTRGNARVGTTATE